MKTVLTALGCLFATLAIVEGQGLSIALGLEQEHFLPGESLVVKVRLTNFTGQPLELGKDNTWLTFSVENSRKLGVAKRGTVPVEGVFTLEPSTTGIKKVDLAPYFDMTEPGRYYLSATVLLPQWRQALQTKQIPVDIIRGSSLWEQEFGVPDTAKGPGDQPEVRRYALVQTLHAKVIQLYFRLTDSKQGHIFGIYPLGQMVSFSNPEPQIDKFSNFHVLYQSSGRMFVHCLVNPDGILVARETYEYSNSRPTLRAEKDGRIIVVGGVRRIMPNDLPPPVDLTTSPHADLPRP